jgi:hypothetical protein
MCPIVDAQQAINYSQYCRSALAAIRRPLQQSGQSMIQEIYDLARLFQEGGNRVSMVWAPKQPEFALGTRAKVEARRATTEGCEPVKRPYQSKSTTVRQAIAKQRQEKVLPDGVGKYSRRIDRALPGRHTHILYDWLKRKEAIVLAQLRTGMTRLNSYLSKMGAAELDLCICGRVSETVEHFLFRCPPSIMMRGLWYFQTAKYSYLGDLTYIQLCRINSTK